MAGCCHLLGFEPDSYGYFVPVARAGCKPTLNGLHHELHCVNIVLHCFASGQNLQLQIELDSSGGWWLQLASGQVQSSIMNELAGSAPIATLALCPYSSRAIVVVDQKPCVSCPSISTGTFCSTLHQLFQNDWHLSNYCKMSSELLLRLYSFETLTFTTAIILLLAWTNKPYCALVRPFKGQ